VDIDSASLVLSRLNEIDSIVKDAFDVLIHMVFQMVPLIFKFLRMVILRVVSRAVNHMSDLIGLQSLLVLGNQV